METGAFGAVGNAGELSVKAGALGGLCDVIGAFLDAECIEFKDKKADAVLGVPGCACFCNNGEQFVAKVVAIGSEGAEIGEADKGG